jgi:hypothetical protein
VTRSCFSCNSDFVWEGSYLNEGSRGVDWASEGGFECVLLDVLRNKLPMSDPVRPSHDRQFQVSLSDSRCV